MTTDPSVVTIVLPPETVAVTILISSSGAVTTPDGRTVLTGDDGLILTPPDSDDALLYAPL